MVTAAHIDTVSAVSELVSRTADWIRPGAKPVTRSMSWVKSDSSNATRSMRMSTT